MYTVYVPQTTTGPGIVVSVRVSAELNRRLSAAARRRRQSRSETARALLEAGLTAGAADPLKEARRQSRLVSRRESEQEALDFIATSADLRGWR